MRSLKEISRETKRRFQGWRRGWQPFYALKIFVLRHLRRERFGVGGSLLVAGIALALLAGGLMLLPLALLKRLLTTWGGLARKLGRCRCALPLILGTALLAYLLAGITVIQPYQQLVLAHHNSEWSHSIYAMYDEPGVYWFDPFAERWWFVLNWSQPDFEALLRMAKHFDEKYDELKGGYVPPETEEDLQRLLAISSGYIDKHIEAKARDVTIGRFEMFTPEVRERASAHLGSFWYCGDVFSVSSLYLEGQYRDDEPIWGTLVHEQLHSALYIAAGGWANETLTQLMTLEVLSEMVQDGVPGAEMALYDELRGTMLAAARYVKDYRLGMRATDLESVAALSYELTLAEMAEEAKGGGTVPPFVGWVNLGGSYTYADSPLRTFVYGLLTGDFSLRRAPLTDTPGYWLMQRAMEHVWKVRVEGVAIAGRVLYEGMDTRYERALRSIYDGREMRKALETRAARRNHQAVSERVNWEYATGVAHLLFTYSAWDTGLLWTVPLAKEWKIEVEGSSCSVSLGDQWGDYRGQLRRLILDDVDDYVDSWLNVRPEMEKAELVKPEHTPWFARFSWGRRLWDWLGY